MRRFASLFVALVPVTLAGCFTLVGPPPGGYESDEIACADERDNDQDGQIDCQDADCLRGGFCGEQIPIVPPRNQAENTYDLCTDGVDNDDNGKFDCGDTNCQNIMELCCSVEVDDEICSDLIDNDGNGFADCADYSCRNNPFVTVCQSEAGRCTDRVDNDGDRNTDCNDTDCALDPACLPPPESDCGNGADDNADGSIDCADPTCHGDPSCTGVENTVAFCQDGFDNDDNGFVDCNDFGCSMSTDPAVLAVCADAGEHSLEKCSNGIDDDANRYTDCGDRGCTDPARGASQEAVDYCAARAENTPERCMDGSDNDGNGYTDCSDFSCSRSTDPAILSYCATQTETTLAACTDHRDNDQNGYVDCVDRNCNFVLIGWGVEICATQEECAAGFTCNSGFCERDCSGGGSCPAGTQCLPATGRCIQSCAEDAECDAGESCYRGRCTALRSPCHESLWFDASSTIQGNQDAAFPQDSTCEEQVRMARAACRDGADNDGDGFTDCEDWECNHDPRVIVEDPVQACASAGSSGVPDGTPVCRFAGGRTCLAGPRAGMACAADADCVAGLSGACSLPGPAGRTFVCP